jgi:AcrR family transcriptional regulator
MQAEATPRPRVRRGELSRERVLAAALELLERDGESSLSMRRIAAELGTAPMSLYRHVQDKADLVDGVIALALAELSTAPPEGDDWAERAQAWMCALREELHRHPAIVPLLRSNHLLLPAVLAPVEVLLEDLRTAGFERVPAARAAWEMLWFTMSFVLTEQRSEQPPAIVAFATAETHADDLPLIAEALPDLLGLGGNDIFDSASRHLVQGLNSERGRS